MKSILFLIILCLAIVSLLPLPTSSQSVAPMNENHQQESRGLASAGATETAGSPMLPDLLPTRGSRRNAPLEPGTILLFGTGLLALGFQWRFRTIFR